MTLLNIAIFAGGAFLFGLLRPAWRGWALLVVSVIALYWLQPALSLYPLDFILPTASVALTMAAWMLVRPAGQITRDDQLSFAVIAGTVLLLAYIGSSGAVTPSIPPPVIEVAVAILAVGVVLFALAPLVQARSRVIPLFILLIIIVFVVLKWTPLTELIAVWLRGQSGRPLTLANAADLSWLGFSYISFRLIHTLRDKQTGKLPDLSLREYVTYVIFFPAITAGPIDRAERFIKDYRAVPTLQPLLTSARIMDGGGRIMIGLLKKFVIAALLIDLAMDATNVTQARSAAGLWLFVYSYAFLLFFDFSGYTDIAIGIGKLYGITLPENFNAPYLKSSLTTFWQSWHITLSTWARFYVFSPVSRALLGMKVKLPTNIVVLLAQVATMLVIGLWHGITWNFVIWGLWHGVGLWAHKLYADRTRWWYQGIKSKPGLYRALEWAGIFLTFHYVVLGWVWFALPTPELSLSVLRRLFGMNE